MTMKRHLIIMLLAVFCCFLGFPGRVLASETLAGPVYAEVIEVKDGDTIRVAADIWLDNRIYTNVRLRGIDTPEIKSKCQAERDAAIRAKNFLTKSLQGQTVTLRNISHDKYGGRVNADVEAGGINISEKLITQGIAKRYENGKRHWNFCNAQ